MDRLKQFVRETGGAEIAEAALTLPLVFMLLLGIYWFGRAFNTYATINHAARQGVRAAITQTCAACGNTPAGVTAAVNQVNQALLASSLDPKQVSPGTSTPTACPGATLSCNPSGGTPNIQYCTNVLLDNSGGGAPPSASGPAACGVSVSFQYPYQFYLPFTSLNMQLITLSADVQMKGEN